MSPQPILEFKRFSAVECFRVGLETAARIVRMKASGPVVVKLRFKWTSGEVQPRFVDVAAFSVRPGHPDHDRCSVCDSTETFVALA